jgi:hypothetical protein
LHLASFWPETFCGSYSCANIKRKYQKNKRKKEKIQISTSATGQNRATIVLKAELALFLLFIVLCRDSLTEIDAKAAPHGLAIFDKTARKSVHNSIWKFAWTKID